MQAAKFPKREAEEREPRMKTQSQPIETVGAEGRRGGRGALVDRCRKRGGNDGSIDRNCQR